MAKNLLSRRSENYVYIGLWTVAVGVWLLDMMRTRMYAVGPLVDTPMLVRMVQTMWPFIALFLVNNLVLLPRLLLRNRTAQYFLGVAALVLAVWGYQALMFKTHAHFPKPPMPHHMPRPLIALPLYLDFAYDCLVVGLNLAVALIFQRVRDRYEHQCRLKADAESRLSYLKAQINPHFYMNMLNNIHGMIELNPAKAQDMVMDMSHLMRYMLYDSSRKMIALSAEMDFLSNYLRIMRVRYPEDKVRISVSLPAAGEVAGIRVPPLIFLVFLENAFKHGISFDGESFVAVSLEVAGGEVRFSCLNSLHPGADRHPSGIGLENARQRLRLIYGERYRLTTRSDADVYTVHLIIPPHENSDTDS